MADAPSQRDDATLLRGAVVDREAFAAFYGQHVRVVLAWFEASVVSDRAVAAELCAETFAEALRSLRRFNGQSPGSGTAWLFGIARNLAREHWRHERVVRRARVALEMRSPTLVLDETDAPDARMDAAASAARLAAALASLPQA